MLKADREKDKQEYIDKLIEEAISESKFVLQENANSNEFKNLLRLSIEKLGMLLIQGIEIVPAIKSKPVIKELSKKTTNNIHAKRKLIILLIYCLLKNFYQNMSLKNLLYKALLLKVLLNYHVLNLKISLL